MVSLTRSLLPPSMTTPPGQSAPIFLSTPRPARARLDRTSIVGYCSRRVAEEKRRLAPPQWSVF